MKKLKTACLALLLICSSALIPTRAGNQKIIWTFYSEANDMTVYYNPGFAEIGSIYWPYHSVTDLGSSSGGTVTYYPDDQVLYLNNFQVEADGVWQGIYGAFEKQ